MRNHIQFHQRFGQGQRSLFRVLLAYANYDHHVGYCQGMATVVAFLLTYFDEEVTRTTSFNRFLGKRDHSILHLLGKISNHAF